MLLSEGICPAPPSEPLQDNRFSRRSCCL